MVLAGVGLGLAVPAAVVALVGLENALTVWNDEMGLLPWGLARILGITVYLDIPADTAWFAAGVRCAIAVVGVLLALPSGAAIAGRSPRSRCRRPDELSARGCQGAIERAAPRRDDVSAEMRAVRVSGRAPRLDGP